MNSHPLVTVICPTTHDRAEFNGRILTIFQQQDYPHKEILFCYADGNVGEKRNRLCRAANGSIIVHMDSDDSYAPNWVTKSVDALLIAKCDIVGLSSAIYQEQDGQKWRYDYPPHTNIHGATMCYLKSFWEQRKFANMQVGEDTRFTERARLFSHDYIDGFTATIHEGNTSPKNLTGERWVML